MKKLSVQSVQQKLMEAQETRKVRWETMKKNARMHAVGSLGNPSTQITSIKQISVPKEVERKSDTHAPFVLQAQMAGSYVDKMARGIFKKEGGSGAPHSTPPVTKLRPNQQTNQRKVSADMQKGSRKSEGSNSQLWPAAEMAGHYIDGLPRGNIYSNDNDMSGGVKAPSAKNLHGTTRPKSSEKTADMTRLPVKNQPASTEPDDNFPMPSDAPPKKRPWGHVKSGVLVRVNESVKARFDIVSTKVLMRIAENYQRFGYRVVVESSRQQPRWKSDKPFLRLVYEAAAARQNNSSAFYRKLTGAALNRLYQLSQADYNNLYENRQEFLGTLRIAFGQIMESAASSFRKNLNLFICKARLVAEGTMSDVEILSEATDHQMALRLVRNKLMEQFGLDTQIKFIFVDGTKYMPNQIKEWVPRVGLREESEADDGDDGSSGDDASDLDGDDGGEGE